MDTGPTMSMLRAVGVCAAAAVMGGCAALLPKSKETSGTDMKGYEDAQKTFERIVPGKTTLADLRQMKLNPESNSSMTILTYSEVRGRFMPNQLVHLDDLDGGVRDCLAERSTCRGLEMKVTASGKRRTGNALLDLLRFHRQTKTTGWAFNGLILLKGDVVVYTLTGGQPRIEIVAEETNPLGVLQDAMTKVAAVGAQQAMRGSSSTGAPAASPGGTPADPIPPSGPAAAITLR